MITDQECGGEPYDGAGLVRPWLRLVQIIVIPRWPKEVDEDGIIGRDTPKALHVSGQCYWA